ncbi:MAG: hypothetical protein AAGA92_08340 [Planctomycetota bacterium]
MIEPRRSWFRPRLRTTLVVALVGLVAWSGYTTWQTYSERTERRARELMTPTAGANCRVICKDPSGKDFEGRFVRMNSEWVVLETVPGIEYWVPRENVAFLTVKP